MDLIGTRAETFTVTKTVPEGPVLIGPRTTVRLETREAGPEASTITYEDIGGLHKEIRRIREMIELPLRYPEVFERLGIDPPKGVLLHGPPGCGKTLIARAVAHETSAIREVFTEIPNTSWTDIGGLEDIKALLVESVEWPLRYGMLFKKAGIRAPKGILLHGVPGSGKTLLAKALAKESEVNFIAVKGPQLMSMYVGESERGVREVFRKARQASPCIIFFDEMDALAPKRGGMGDSQVTERVVSQLLTEMDGIEDLENVVVVGATNRLDRLDPALLRPGRFDFMVEMPKPDREARKAIFEVHTRNMPLGDDVSLDTLADGTDGLVGADIEGICRQAAMNAIRKLLEGGFEISEAEAEAFAGRLHVDRQHFDEAIEQSKR